MARKANLLHELLQEDQEPFLLKNYIADRKSQIKAPLPKHRLQLSKRKPISHNSNFPSNLCRKTCFFSGNVSPEPRKSPLFEFPSPVKSPCRSPNAIFLHIPARTAALLLDAAVRIQKQSSNSKKTKTQNKNHGFGLFGSILKRLTHRNRNRNREISGDGVTVSVKDILRWDSSKKISSEIEQMKDVTVCLEGKSALKTSTCEMGFSCSCNARSSSAVWSESNEEKSLDMDVETSSSGQSEDSEEIEFASNKIGNTEFVAYEQCFCESPFRFVLQRSPSSGHLTPEFSSPVASPSRLQKEDKDNYEIEKLKKFQVADQEEEDDKEQFSPVSVLDPPFEEDDEDHEDEDEENDSFDDPHCSYAIVQKAKQQLLQKLRRFERLAELDPIELEKRMLEQEEDNDNDSREEENEWENESVSSDIGANSMDRFVREVLESRFHNLSKEPDGMKRLVTDLIAEEQKQHNCLIEDEEEMVKRVWMRLDSWKEVESNTIDMMVEQDFRREIDGWKRRQEQIGEVATEIEFSICGLLLEELSDELVCLAGI